MNKSLIVINYVNESQGWSWGTNANIQSCYNHSQESRVAVLCYNSALICRSLALMQPEGEYQWVPNNVVASRSCHIPPVTLKFLNRTPVLSIMHLRDVMISRCRMRETSLPPLFDRLSGRGFTTYSVVRSRNSVDELPKWLPIYAVFIAWIPELTGWSRIRWLVQSCVKGWKNLL